MTLKKATVLDHSKKISLRKCPWDPLADHDVLKLLRPGDKLTVSIDHMVYDWTDNSYFEVYESRQIIGYVRTDAVTIE